METNKSKNKQLVGITGPSSQALQAAERMEAGPKLGKSGKIPKATASGSSRPKPAPGLAQQRIDQIQGRANSSAGGGDKNRGTTEKVPCKGATEPKVRPSTVKTRKDEPRRSPQPGTSRKPENSRQTSPVRKSKSQLIKLSYGLSGAGVKRYWKLINEGLPAEVARRKAGKKTGPPTGMTGTRAELRTGVPVKRQPVQRPVSKVNKEQREPARRVTKGQSYARALKSIKMAVFAASSPNEMLTGTQLSDLQDAIIDEAVAKADIKPKFEGIQFRPGMLIIECTNEETATWLKRAVPTMDTWTSPKLCVKPAEEAPKTTVVSIFFPRSAGKDSNRILETLNAQNEGLRTGAWKIMRAYDENEGKKLIISIDEQSLQAIAKENMTVSFRFGRLSVIKGRSGEAKASSNSTPHEGVANEATAAPIQEVEAPTPMDTETVPSDAHTGSEVQEDDEFGEELQELEKAEKEASSEMDLA